MADSALGRLRAPARVGDSHIRHAVDSIGSTQQMELPRECSVTIALLNVAQILLTHHCAASEDLSALSQGIFGTFTRAGHVATDSWFQMIAAKAHQTACWCMRRGQRYSEGA